MKFESCKVMGFSFLRLLDGCVSDKIMSLSAVASKESLLTNRSQSGPQGLPVRTEPLNLYNRFGSMGRLAHILGSES